MQAVAIGLFVLPLHNWPSIWLTVAWWVMGAAIVLTVVTGLDYVISRCQRIQVADPASR